MVTLHAAGPLSAPRVVRANRRAVPRVPAGELHWLDRVRLQHGDPVALIDLSAGGALFEVTTRVHPGDATALEFLAQGDRTVALGRIVRSEIAGIQADAIRYRGACEFSAPLAWARRLPASNDRDAAANAPTLARVSALRASWGGWSEATALFRHGRRLAGFVRAFDPSAETVDVWPSPTAALRQKQPVPLALLRAIHFLRDVDAAGHPIPPESNFDGLSQAEVVFRNNEVVRGAIAGYEPDAIGFFILPADHNPAHRVFAVSGAVAEIRVF